MGKGKKIVFSNDRIWFTSKINCEKGSLKKQLKTLSFIFRRAKTPTQNFYRLLIHKVTQDDTQKLCWSSIRKILSSRTVCLKIGHHKTLKKISIVVVAPFTYRENVTFIITCRLSLTRNCNGRLQDTPLPKWFKLLIEREISAYWKKTRSNCSDSTFSLDLKKKNLKTNRIF